MRLLFDEQLSPRLVPLLRDVFPDAAHVHDIGLGSGDDRVIFQYAREHDFAVVTKDSDFADLVHTLGAPPRVVWLNVGNCSTSAVASVLRAHRHTLAEFEADPEAAVLVVTAPTPAQ